MAGTDDAVDAGCSMCGVANGTQEVPGGLLHQDDHWAVRHTGPPYPLAGWLTLLVRRHVHEPSTFGDAERASFGPVVARCQEALREATGVEKVYMAAFSEKTPHFHLHLVPRFSEMPGGATGAAAFSLVSRVRVGEIEPATEQQVDDVSERFRRAMGSRA